MARCRSCGAEVIWATTANDKPMPLDATPDPKGLFVVEGGVARRATAEDGYRYTSHFATCPQADQHRRAR